MRSTWKNDEILSGTVTYIECRVNVKAFVNDNVWSVILDNTVSYYTDKRVDEK